MKYINILLKNENLYGDTLNINSSERINFNRICQERFENILLRYREKVKNLKFKEKNKEKNMFGTAIIDDRCDESLEVLIRIIILKLGVGMNHYVFGFKKNELFLKNLLKGMEDVVKIIILDKEGIKNVNDYNDLMLSLNFWNNFKEKKILIYQKDSFLFRGYLIDKYLKFDYIGAIWPHFPNNLYNGNGGLSIRNVELMKDIIKLNNYDNNSIPEDLFISFIINKNPIFFSEYSFPNIEDCGNFSIENIKIGDNYLGGHQFWFCLKNWEKVLNENLSNLVS